jgi:hypothetical protein
MITNNVKKNPAPAGFKILAIVGISLNSTWNTFRIRIPKFFPERLTGVEGIGF